MKECMYLWMFAFLNVKSNMVHEILKWGKDHGSELIGGIRCDDTCGMFRFVFFWFGNDYGVYTLYMVDDSDSDGNEYMKSSFDPKVNCAHDDILQ